jgi:RHS repeat-associated protein
MRAQWFDAPLIPTREPTASENEVLITAVEQFATRTVRDDFSSLERFLENNPRSPWAPGLQAQLGSEYYRVGRYSRAIDAWNRAWTAQDAETGDDGMASANRAGSELALMYARLGRMAELRPLLGQLERRPNSGQVPRNLRGARDGLWSMEHRPEVSFRCGPLALDRICFATDRSKAGNQLIQDSQSTKNGFSAKELAELSRQLGMNYQVAFRSAGAEVILPAVVHWKVGHYAALIARDGELLRAEDPTFGTSKVWLSDDALDDEASGYFLVRPGALPSGWRAVSESEAHQVWGKGTTLKSYEDATTPYDEKLCGGGGGRGMAKWNVHLLLASHEVEDTPIGYTPPIGPPIDITASYSALNGWPDFGLPYSNISQEWRLNWVAYLMDDPMNPFGDIRFAADGGGSLTFTDYNATNKVFRNLFYGRARLVRINTNRYELHYPDGWKKVFDHPTTGVGTTRRIFMSAIVDAAGNAATIQFDQPGRIATITDAIGQRTQFFYERPLTNEFIHPTVAWVPPYIITRVVDPFGRTATFDYGSSINARLASITDGIGVTSSFRYDYNPGQVDLGMTNLITPYGTTVFSRGKYSGLYRANWVEITHPNGEKERVEYSEKAPAGVFSSDPLGIVPKGVPVRNYILWARNTYHWDRKAYAEGYALNDYSKARIYHWTHGQDYNTASPILESYKNPLEHRIWFNYDGQVNPTFAGSSDRPTTISRTMADGTTQTRRFEYNSVGKPTKAIDPVGRTLSLTYSTNHVDLTEVGQTRAGNNEVLFRATYNSQHRPLTITDAAGQTTFFTYNVRGQLHTATNPLGDTATHWYDTNGYLLAIDGPLPGTNDTSRFTYDAVGRLHTRTDVDGYTLTFQYDGLDRVTRVTYPDATYEEITYNRLDPEILRDRAGRETRLTHDSLGQLVAVEDPLGRITQYDWCGCGALDAIIDPVGRTTHWLRDLQGRVAAKVFPDGSQTRYDYDRATGQLQSIRDERNQITRFDYNLDGTLRQKRYFNALVPTPGVRFTYDPNYQRVVAMEDGTGLTTYSYHPITGSSSPGAGRLSAIDGPLANDTINFAYDTLGRLTQRNINGARLQVSWDAAGRVIETTNSLGVFGFDWHGGGFRLAAIRYPQGQRTALDYHPGTGDHRLKDITHARADANLLARFTYQYDTIGRITNWTQQRATAEAWMLGYDGADRLVSAEIRRNGTAVENYSYSYDAAGNRLSEQTSSGLRAFHANALNQVTEASDTNASATTYEWDAAQHLVAINQGTNRTEFVYDGLDRRVSVIEKSGGAITSGKSLLWCGPTLCEERDAGGSVVTKRLFDAGEEVMSGLTNGKYYYFQDHLGSIREIVNAAGMIEGSYDYDAFGARTQIAGGFEPAVGFTGHYLHQPSGLYLTLYRAYSPALARWVSRDWLAEAAGANLYAYVDNDPVNWSDPLGLMKISDEFRKNYPRATERIETLSLRLSKDAYKGFKKYGNASERQVRTTIFSRTKGPSCGAGDLADTEPGGYTAGSYNRATKTITLDEKLVKRFERGEEVEFLFDTTVEHELVHYFDDVNNQNRYPGEEGQDYERGVYGTYPAVLNRMNLK